MVDLEKAIELLGDGHRFKVLSSLKILVDVGFFEACVRTNKNQLVEGKLDQIEEDALVKEIRELRQTNRVLSELEETARQLTKDIES